MIHWQKVLKVIRDSGREGINREKIAERIEVERDCEELGESLEYLHMNGKVSAALGATEKGGVALVYQLPQPRRSRREDIKFDPEVDEIFDPPERRETVSAGETPQPNEAPSHRSEKIESIDLNSLQDNEIKKEPQ